MALVQVEAYLNRKKKYFSTKVYLVPINGIFKKRMVKNHLMQMLSITCFTSLWQK